MNAKLILLHTLAVLLLMMAFNRLALLYDIGLLEAYSREGKKAMKGVKPDQLVDFLLAQSLIPFLGLMIGVVVSFILAKKRKQAIGNAFIVLALALLIFGSKLYEKVPSLSLGHYITRSPIAVIILNTAPLLCIAVWIYFSSNNRYVTNQNG